MGWKTETSSRQVVLAGNDTAPQLSEPPSAFYVASAGDIHWKDAAGNEHTFTFTEGVYPWSIYKLYATGTTAIILGLYD